MSGISIRGHAIEQPFNIGQKASGSTSQRVSITSATLDNGVMLNNLGGLDMFVSHNTTVGEDLTNAANSVKYFKLKSGEQVFMECDNIFDITFGHGSGLEDGTELISFKGN